MRQTIRQRSVAFLPLLFMAAVFSSGWAAPVHAEDSVAETPEKYLVYVGTYTRGDSKGIYILELDMKTGKLTPRGVVEGVVNPSFLAIHPTEKYLYAVGEISDFNGEKSGGVTAFAVEKDGNLTKLNSQSSMGAGPCHLVVDDAGKNVLVANYGGGSIACLPIGPDGKLKEASAFVQHGGIDPETKKPLRTHAHSINLDAANKHAIVADLGLNKVLVYKFDADKGSLELSEVPTAGLPPKSGPRHFAFHPNGKFGYVINETALTMSALAYNPEQGQFITLQTISTIPDEARDQKGLSTAEVRVHPSGKFVYGSNRGHNTIVVFRIDQEKGTLTLVENVSTQGETPRNFFIDPTGKYLLAENQNSNTIVVFSIDPETGKLSPTGNVAEVPIPVCIRMIPLK